jgi:hypothetical protein
LLTNSFNCILSLTNSLVAVVVDDGQVYPKISSAHIWTIENKIKGKNAHLNLGEPYLSKLGYIRHSVAILSTQWCWLLHLFMHCKNSLTNKKNSRLICSHWFKKKLFDSCSCCFNIFIYTIRKNNHFTKKGKKERK